ncbi:MAG: oligosaccharide flippase family protein [Symploca sp. SIO2E6]|nr:oligosaccharide flippase family protein [Symploca sp. SIO2E6]
MESLNTAVKKIAKGAGITFVGKVASTGLKYLTQVTLAQLLGAELFGIYTLGFVIYQFGELFARMGLENGAVRYVSIHHGAGETRKLKGVLLQAVGLSFVSGLALGIVLLLASGPIAKLIFGKPELVPALRLFAIALPFGASMIVGAFATTGFQVTTYRVYIWELLLPFTNLLLAALFCTLGWGLWGTTVAWVIAVMVALAATLYFIRRLFPAIASRDIKPIFEGKQLLRFSLPLAFGTFLWLVMIWTDVLMLGYFRAATEVGIYRAASQTAFLMTIFSASLNSIFAPIIADLHHRQAIDKMGQIFQATTRWSLSLSVPLFLVVTAASQDILGIFGAEFVIGSLPLVMLGIGQLVRAGTDTATNTLIMSGHQYTKLLGDIGSVIVNISLNILLIPRWGLMGAAIATGISISGVHLWRMWQVKLVLAVQPFNWSYCKIIGAGAIAGLSGFAVHAWLTPMPSLVSVVVTAGAIVVVYATLLLAMGLEEADRMILEEVQKRLGFKK